MDYPLRNSAILDTGATLHVFNQATRFIGMRTAGPEDYIYAGEAKVPVLGYGSVDIELESDAGPRILRLRNVAFCPNFATNLVSFWELERTGIDWDSKNQLLRDRWGRAIGRVQRRHRQYVLEYIPDSMSATAFHIRRNKHNSWTERRTAAADARLWHLRLGHPGPRVVDHLEEVSYGVKVSGRRAPTMTECDNCGTAKMTRRIRRQPRHDGSLTPGQVLAIDFHDYTKDDQGFSSAMLITDRATGFVWDYYFQKRTAREVIDVLRFHLAFIKKHHRLEPLRIESDNELGDQRKAVKKFIEEDYHIIFEPSAPYTASQNGGAERTGRTIKDKARAMRGKLPIDLWREITKSAVYLYNRSPRERKTWTTPYEALHGRQPRQQHLRAFGCKIYALTTKAKKRDNRLQKLAPRAWIGFLVGYTSSNIYRVWVPGLGRTISTRDVAFNEAEFFNGDLQNLRDDIREVDLQQLAQDLQEIAATNIDEELPTMDPDRRGIQAEDHDDIFDDDDDEEDEEGPSNQDEAARTLAPGPMDLDQDPSARLSASPEPEPSPVEPLIKTDFLPTPPESPPAAFLATMAAVAPSIPHAAMASAAAAPTIPGTPDTAWQAEFLAGMKRNTVAQLEGKDMTRERMEQQTPINRSNALNKFQEKTGNRASLQRTLADPKAHIHRRDLPPPPARNEDVAGHDLAPQFRQAQLDHLASHKEMKSWEEVGRHTLDKGVPVLGCMWVFIYKFDKHKRLQKCKARLVVRGDQQARSGHSTYAATLAGKSFRTLIVTAARYDLDLLQYDAVNAFVHADLDEEVFMHMPPGFSKRGRVLRLRKALYGLRKSPLLWQRSFTSTLSKLGCKAVKHEPCCMTKGSLIVFFYVDDIVVAFPPGNGSEAKELFWELGNRYNLTGGKPLEWFLGIEVIRDRGRRLIWLSQKSYIDKISTLIECQPRRCDTPMSTEELLPSDETATPRSVRKYQVKVGSLLYAATTTRPDIAFAVSRLARFLHNPSTQHHRAADRVLAYLKHRSTLALQMGGGDDFEVASDASFADNSKDRKSSQAYAMKLFGGLVGWRANKQATVTTSTTEAELLALSQATKESMFMTRLFQDLSINPRDSHRIRIQCDNENTIRLVTEEVATLKTQLRHIDIHNHWLRQEVEKGAVQVVYTESAELMADGLTKALQGAKYEKFLEQIGLSDVKNQLQGKDVPEVTCDDLMDRFHVFDDAKFGAVSLGTQLSARGTPE